MLRMEGKGHDEETALLRLVKDHAAELLRFARRLSLCADDAQDAYQRAVEILVRRMRSDPPAEPLKWMRTVVRNEALAVRMQRERFVAREELDFDRHEDRALDDPAERAAGFERLGHVAEALQRLKPQEVTALVLRAEGLTYEEICTRTGWTYTKTNRCVTEGRRALLARLGAIESGSECDRWLPQLSLLADGEASARDLAELRPHLRACPACRSTLRDLHGAPRAVAALVPVAVVPLVAADSSVSIRHVEGVVHAVFERMTFAAARVQGALEALPTTKFAAVAASTAALAGGGAAIQQVAAGAGAAPRLTAAPRATASAPAAPIALTFVASMPNRSRRFAAHHASAPDRRKKASAGSEFALEAPSEAPAAAQVSAPSRPVAEAAVAPSPPPSRGDAPTAEFAGP